MLFRSLNGSPEYDYIWENNYEGNLLENLNPGDYSVTISNKWCTTYESYTVLASQIACGEIFIPNIFTPSDQFNNVLYVRGLGISELEFLIFNRWGELVYNGNSIDEGWDGNFRGKPVNSGVYIYIVKGNKLGEDFEMTGNVTLYR